ncbi:MAG: ROK family protein, partial [Bdellovibrionota bacterium]
MKALAIDLGGSHASCALVSGREIFAQKTISYTNNENLIGVLPKISETFRSLVSDQRVQFQDFAGLALGFCGLVDTNERRVLSTNGRFKDAHDLNLRAWSRDSFGLDLVIENDARL